MDDIIHCSTSGCHVYGFLLSHPIKPQAVWRGPGRRRDIPILEREEKKFACPRA